MAKAAPIIRKWREVSRDFAALSKRLTGIVITEYGGSASPVTTTRECTMGDLNIRPSIQSVLVSTSGGAPQNAISHLPPGAPKPKLLDRVRIAIRTRHLSTHTEQAYVGWIKRFIFFHNTRHPLEKGETEIGRFLSRLGPPTDSRRP